MLIQKEKQLHVGDIITFRGPQPDNLNILTNHEVKVVEIYPHWVLGNIQKPEYIEDGCVMKICMTNVELVNQHIYSKNDVEGNSYYDPDKEYNEEFLEKVKVWVENHSTKMVHSFKG